ncbi:isocitrate lyase/phosphoenolpyruvate mutase family protein [Natrinema sp. DC36]|uniref:isocitrate lyase/PEP mutase family protein n=1 Tax=Natrinema sp. DC36 TaxID=2878680 RepID=UPI001CF0CD93|nr:isocitrate lyase/phosphoenolpyruvate mutase family protein [Natrinema sp. DC36]
MTASDATFRDLFTRDDVLLAPGVSDALEATIAERAGAEALYVSGNALATAVHGGPDLGLTTMTETVDRVREIAGAVDLPVFCDADTGYGNALNVFRTVREFERAGTAGLHIEDQRAPKKCGHFDGKRLVPTDEMVGKLEAATDARGDDSFVVVARTDAVAVEGIDAAIDRARTYVDAGADGIFVDAPETEAQLAEIGDRLADVPLVVNLPYGGKSPMLPAERVAEMGYDLLLFATTAQKAKLRLLEEVYSRLVETGDERDLIDRLATWEDRDDVTDLEAWRERERRYAGGRPADRE